MTPNYSITKEKLKVCNEAEHDSNEAILSWILNFFYGFSSRILIAAISQG